MAKWLGLLLVFGSLTVPLLSQTIYAKKEKLVESRIIVRYPEGSGERLNEYVARLENIPGIRRADALRRLDMAVVVCEPGADEDAVLQALDAEKDVELAVPDSWVYAFGASDAQMCSANPGCRALNLQGSCCPAPDGARMACCFAKPQKKSTRQSESTISLQSVHGGYITVSHFGRVGWRGKKTDPDAQIQLEAHPDGYVSLRSSHGTYLVTSPSGHLVAWHRGHGEADDWEKFKLIYNTDDTISLRSKVSDKHVSRDNATSDMLSATTDRVEISERFMVTMSHGKDTLVPNDPRLSKLWAIDHFGDRDMDALEAWKMSSRSIPESAQPVVVAVIDTGIDYTHPDLQESMWVNPNEIAGNGIDDDGNGIVDDIHGADFANNDGDPMDDQMHGTHCAGTIAATGNNSIGIAGVAWQGVRLMALKFLTSTGAGRTSDAVKSLNYAVAMGAHILSNSWGGSGSSSALRVAIERSEHAGVLFLAASGNDGLDNDEVPNFPANYPNENILSVASTTQKGDLSPFSCYGKTTVDVAAPGSDIYSTIPGGDYASLSGTSMATPHVSGLAALIWLYRPELAFTQVKDIILRSTVPEKSLENACVTGGRINARRAMGLASIYPAPRPPIHAPTQVRFADTNPAVGRIGGSVIISAPDDQSDVEYYGVHFLSSSGVLMEIIGKANVSGQKTLSIKLDNLTIPLFAKGMAAVAANSSGRMPVAAAAVLEIEDYGVPEAGPADVSFGGDADPQPGAVAGSIKIRRASNERTVSHYNVYWQHDMQRRDLIGSVPAIGFLSPSCSGDCALLNISYDKGKHRYHRDAYGNNELAVITFSGPATVKITSFLTESYYDYLEIAGTQISGTDLELPKIIHVPRGDQTLTWLSDHSEGQGGWSLELWQEGEEAPFALPTTRSSSGDVKVVAAYGRTELFSEARSCPIRDFDSNSMPPSKAYLPVAVDFADENVDEGFINGVITLTLPEVRMQGIVSSYRVSLADRERIPIEGFSWTVGVDHGSPRENVEIHLSTLQVPTRAVFMVVHAVNSFGESTVSTSNKLIDIVRSAPVFANFSGDEDPVENQIKGIVTIVPASNPKNIIAYTVYLFSGNEKVSLVGRVAATKRGVVRYSLHAAYRSGQSLLVVSSYADKDMEHGVVIPVQDFVESFSGYGWYDWGSGYGGGDGQSTQNAGENRRLDKGIQEPWLKQERKPAADEVQPLWSATDSRTLPLPVSNSGRMPLGNKQGIFATITIPGCLKPVKLAGSEGFQFVPPSVRERRVLAEVLAESLPGVQDGHVKLTLGRAFTGASALPGVGADQQASLPRMMGAASLVVDFEVVPPRLEQPRELQQFFDRVEAKLILLSSGGMATGRLSAALAKRFEQLGYHFPDQGFRVFVGEPQQVAPKRQPGRLLQELHGIKEGPKTEPVQSAWTTSALAFLVSVAGWAAFLSMAIASAKRIRRGSEVVATLESVHVHR